MTPADLTSFSAAELREQVRRAIDPDVDMLAILEADLSDTDLWVGLLGAGASAQWQQLRTLKEDHRALLVSVQDALRLLVPRGWAPFQMDSSVVREAIDLVRSDRPEAADEILGQQWDSAGSWRTKRVCDRVRTLGAGASQRDTEALFAQRARLLTHAKEHHEAGRYEASIPILHAQMEGIVVDVAEGRKFFTKGAAKADLADLTQLIAVQACLPVLQAVFSADVPRTQASGALSRHGVAHGRELAYDTRENSAKCWSVLDAIVEWAMPLARLRTEHELREQQAANAGSQKVSASGRRVDDREFRETRNVLTLLGNSAIGHRRNLGNFRPDLLGGVYTVADFTRRGLPADHGIHMGIASQDSTAWFWRRAISGWVLGYAVAETGSGMVEWFFASEAEPTGPPGDDTRWSDSFVCAGDWV